MGKDYVVERVFQARTNVVSLEKSKYTDDLFGLLFNKHIRNDLKRNRTGEVRYEYEGKGCEQWKMRINSFACNLGYHGSLEKDLICEKESYSEKKHVLVFTDEHGTEIIITSQTREAGQNIEIQLREGAIPEKPDFYDDIIVKTCRFLNSFAEVTEVRDDADAAPVTKSDSEVNTARPEAAVQEITPPVSGMTDKPEVRDDADAASVTKTDSEVNTARPEAAAQEITLPVYEPTDEEKEIERYVQVRRLSEYVFNSSTAGNEIGSCEPGKAFLLKLGQGLFENRTQILEHGSGNREEDIYTVMRQIAELAEQFRITEKSFSDWNVDVFRGCMKYKYAEYSTTCYDGGCYSDDSISYWYNFSVISNSDFIDNIHRGTAQLDKRHSNLFELKHTVSTDPLVFETEYPFELYLYKPFGMCDSMKIERACC